MTELQPQELLAYTPVNAKTLLPLTVAVDLRADYEEVEGPRKLNAITYNGYDYALIKKTARVRLTNYDPEPKTPRISLSFGGRAVEASDGGRPLPPEEGRKRLRHALK